MTAVNVDRDAAKVRKALQAVATAQASLSVWLLALPPDGLSSGDDVSPLQVPLRAIGELIDEALNNSTACAPGLELLYAQGFVAMAESALWNFMASSNGTPPRCEDLCATITQALSYLAALSGKPASIGTIGGAA